MALKDKIEFWWITGEIQGLTSGSWCYSERGDRVQQNLFSLKFARRLSNLPCCQWTQGLGGAENYCCWCVLNFFLYGLKSTQKGNGINAWLRIEAHWIQSCTGWPLHVNRESRRRYSQNNQGRCRWHLTRQHKFINQTYWEDASIQLPTDLQCRGLTLPIIWYHMWPWFKTIHYELIIIYQWSHQIISPSKWPSSNKSLQQQFQETLQEQ